MRGGSAGALIVGQFVGHRGRDKPGRDAVDSGAAGRTTSAAIDFAMPIIAAFGGAVVLSAGIAGYADERGDADDPAVASATQFVPRSAARISRKPAVRLTSSTACQSSSRIRIAEAVAGDASSADQDVDFAERGVGLAGRDGPVRPGWGEIGGQDLDAITEGSAASAGAPLRGCR